jgi:hypothetical protein
VDYLEPWLRTGRLICDTPVRHDQFEVIAPPSVTVTFQGDHSNQIQ